MSGYLCDLDKQQLKSLGLLLGLSSRTVNNMYDCSATTYRDSIVTAWLRRQDNVLEKGLPSWEALVAALEHKQMRLRGDAGRIRDDKLKA